MFKGRKPGGGSKRECVGMSAYRNRLGINDRISKHLLLLYLFCARARTLLAAAAAGLV